jgi:aerobic carbon-monoxide dehydrogenase medium subunit
MKPPAFRYHRPAGIDETVGLLDGLGQDAKLLAGGQSLMPMLNMRLAAPEHVVDINRVRDFPGLSVNGDTVEIGALVRQREAEIADEVHRACPLLGQALGEVGHRPIRSRGTVVGSIVHADPAAELPAVFMLLDGRVYASGPHGRREISCADFYTGYFDTSLEPDELVTAVRVRRVRVGEGTAFVELARRHGDFAICAVAATADADSARVALAGVDARPRVFDVSGLLDGDGDDALDAVADGIEPEGDIHASADYRRHLARELVRRAVAAAIARGGGSA